MANVDNLRARERVLRFEIAAIEHAAPNGRDYFDGWVDPRCIAMRAAWERTLQAIHDELAQVVTEYRAMVNHDRLEAARRALGISA